MARRVRNEILTFSRWNYLQHGITRIMTNLQEGIDLQTVRFHQPACCLPPFSLVSLSSPR